MNAEPYVVAPELDEHEPGPGWLLVLPDKMSDDLQQTAGGLYIGRDPDAPTIAPIRTGTMVAIGPCQDSQAPRNIEVGEKCTFSDTNSVKINLKGVEHLQIMYAQFLGRSVPSDRPVQVPVSIGDDAIVVAHDVPPEPNGRPRPLR